MNFDAFFKEEFASIAVVAGTTAGSRSAGEDIAQEAFAQASKQWDHVSQLDRPGAWVRRVAINLAISRRRRFAAEARALVRLGRPTRSTELDVRIGRPALWEAVDELPPRQRAVIALHYLEDLSTNEIADILEITVSTTTSHLHDARRKLADRLKGSNQ